MSEIKKKIFRVSDISGNALAQRNDIYVKGSDCGFKNGDEFISYRKGYSTGIYSYSAQGKTQFYIQEAVNLSKAHGWKHAIWLTENGRKEELITDIAMTVMGKSLFSPDVVVTDEELMEAYEWMEDYFFIIDHEETIMSIKTIYKAVLDFERDSGIKIDGVAIDNASNLGRDVENGRMSISEYMNYLMMAVNRTSLKFNYHTFILFHVNPPDQVECSATGLKYQPCPNHYMISGGQQINYLGYQLVCVWRPISREEQVGIINPKTDEPFMINETHIVVTKTKPKAVGAQGSFIIYFDRDVQRYYEWVDDVKYYVGEYFIQHGGGNAPEKPKEKFKPKQAVLDQESIFKSALPDQVPISDSAIQPNVDF